MTTTRRAVLAATLAGAARVAYAGETWRIVTEYPPTAIPGEGIAAFADLVARSTAGGLAVRPKFDGLRSAAMIAAVSDGRIEAADAFTGALAAEAPIFQLSALPFLTGSGADTKRLLSAARPAYQAVLATRGLSLLYATPWPASGIWSRHPLSAPEALTGLRIRTYDAASTAVFRLAGAAPQQLSFADAKPRLQSGNLDAVLSSGDGGAGARLWELLPHFTALDYASPLSLAFCRTALLAALSATVQAAVMEAAQATEARQFQAIMTRAAENETRMRANGVSIGSNPALRQVLVQAADPVIEDWKERAGPMGRTVLSTYR